MATSKSALKQARESAKKHLLSKSIRSAVKTEITKAEKLILAGQLEEAKKDVASAISSLDAAASKGALHPNNVARRKSRLIKKLNQAQLVASTKTEPEKK